LEELEEYFLDLKEDLKESEYSHLKEDLEEYSHLKEEYRFLNLKE
jgi:hypothetical protein